MSRYINHVNKILEFDPRRLKFLDEALFSTEGTIGINKSTREGVNRC
jgi:hypothetical protein